MKTGTLIFALFLVSGLSYSQSYKLRHLEGNNHLVKTVHLNERNLCSEILEKYNELEKDERGWIRTIVLNLKNDTLAIIEVDSTQQKTRTSFNAGKRIETTPIIYVYQKGNSEGIKNE